MTDIITFRGNKKQWNIFTRRIRGHQTIWSALKEKLGIDKKIMIRLIPKGPQYALGIPEGVDVPIAEDAYEELTEVRPCK